VKVSVDPVLCTGHGRCYALGPEVFGEDERGRCRVLNEVVPPELGEQARLGEDNCPEQAIRTEDG
jgi:ferredoxin